MPWRSLSRPRSDRLEVRAVSADSRGGRTRTTAAWRMVRLTLPATTGQSLCLPSRGLGEQLNDRFPATSLGLSSAGPGQERPLASDRSDASPHSPTASLAAALDMEEPSA